MDIRIVHHSDMGYACEMRNNGFWQQISFWYTTLKRLETYFIKPNYRKRFVDLRIVELR